MTPKIYFHAPGTPLSLLPPPKQQRERSGYTPHTLHTHRTARRKTQFQFSTNYKRHSPPSSPLSLAPPSPCPVLPERPPCPAAASRPPSDPRSWPGAGMSRHPVQRVTSGEGGHREQRGRQAAHRGAGGGGGRAGHKNLRDEFKS